MTQKVKIKLILMQISFLLFFIYGIQRLINSYHSEKIKALLNDNTVKFESLSVTPAPEFITYLFLWSFYAMITGIIIIVITNWKNKTSIWNTLIFVAMSITFIPLGVLNNKFINGLLNSTFQLISSNIKIYSLVSGLFLTIIAFLLYWKTIEITRSTIHNNGYK